MARANRHYLPGYVWHITHRCHKSEYLMKFNRDRRRWMQWLFEAKKRFGISILNYMVTSNHVHLVIHDNKGEAVVPKTVQLVAGRTGQEYNQRKERKGAFWEDRYHATAVEADEHLVKCLVYVDLNMVRAGVVNHPSEWKFSGYNEIQYPRMRYAIIDYAGLMMLLGAKTMDELKKIHKVLVEESLQRHDYNRQSQWTESIAVGSKAFVRGTKERLGIKALGREVIGSGGTYELRQTAHSYSISFKGKNGDLRQKNAFHWNDSI